MKQPTGPGTGVGACRPTAPVETTHGTVVGLDGEVRAFLGIRYAAPPLGEHRWRPPRPPAAWTGHFSADRFGDDFPQAANPLLRAPAQSEDCLTLNIWSPGTARPGSLPVLVWFHGGGFVSGSGSDVRCDGRALAAAGAVVVTFNYRSGIFGFLAHPGLSRESDRGTCGNYGLLDQIAALEWVRDNIAAFGGSANRVTVFGVSAGSASISLLLTSPLATGLFQRAALHSPGACRPLASLADAEQAGLRVGADLAALRQLSASALFERTGLLVPKMRGLTTPRILRPIRDGWVIPSDELDAFDGGTFEAMPVLVGTNEDEGSKLTANWTVDTPDAYRALLRETFGTMADRAGEVYPAQNAQDVRRRVAELFGDTQFDYGTWRLATAMADAGRPTYRYVFRRRRPGRTDGPHHGDEVAYVFDNLDLLADAQSRGPSRASDRASAADPVGPLDRAVARAMHGAWLRFATHGDPNGGDLAHWPGFSAGEPRHMSFGDHVEAGVGWRAPQIAFIDAFHHRA